MPEHLTWVVVYNRFLLNLSLRSVSNCVFLGLNKITSVFATFNDIYLYSTEEQAVLSLC